MTSFPLLCFLYHSRNITSNNTMTITIAATTLPAITPAIPEDELPAPSLTPTVVLLGPNEVEVYNAVVIDTPIDKLLSTTGVIIVDIIAGKSMVITDGELLDTILVDRFITKLVDTTGIEMDTSIAKIKGTFNDKLLDKMNDIHNDKI